MVNSIKFCFSRIATGM
ncbi:peptide IlvX [Scandinavium tedordense]